MNGLYFAVIALLISLSVGRILIPRIVFISMKKRLFDVPNARKMHTRQISRLGGIAFLPASVIACCLTLFIMQKVVPDDVNRLVITYLPNATLFITGLAIIFLMGIIDDISGMMYRHKFVIQAIAALIIVAPLMYVKNLYGILGIWELNPVVSIPLTTIGVILIINSYNLIDGVDGLCSGLSIVTLTVLSVALLADREYLILILSSAMIGVLLIFFFYNVFGKRMKIFMGDTGSLILGFFIAYVALHHVDIVTLNTALTANPFALVVGAIFVPVFDATRLFVFRMIKGHSPFMPDKNHIHHKFIAIGLSHIQTTFTIITIQFVYIVLNFMLSESMNINTIIFIDICVALSINFALNTLISKKKTALAK